MANNLKKFTTEAEYNAATLSYPAVSWVTSGDTVHFDKAAPAPTVNDKIMMCWTTPYNVSQAADIVVYNTSASPTGIEYCSAVTLNNVDVTQQISDGVLNNATIPNSAVTYTLKYSLADEYYHQVSDAFAGDLGGGWGSDENIIDFLVPAQITDINGLPNNPINSLVIETTTPPTINSGWSQAHLITNVYVPDSAVNTYKNDSTWGEGSSIINPISEYQGNLPV